MKAYFLVPVILASGALARAQEGPVFSLGGSSLGATLEAGLRLGPAFGLRGVAGYASAGFESEYNGTPLTGTATIGGVGILADFYLGRNARVSAGAIAPDFGADLAITGDMVVNGSTINNVDITGSIDTINRFAPVLAVGYEKALGGNWGISADFGAIYTGGFYLSASDNSGQIPQADLDSELESTNTALGQITILPFVKLGVSFSF